MSTLAAAVAAGHEGNLARALTVLEKGGVDAIALRRTLLEHTGRAMVVGVTGPPGAGKSSLIGALIGALRNEGKRVAVLAVDPSSPLSGGAVLGDRTRMGEHTLDPGVFIRSVSSRGQSGGLSRAVPALIDALDAAGWDVVLLETVGSGQSDVDIAEYADVAVLVSVPGLGDDVQAIKAGMLEVADILVVNKSDLPGAARTARQLEQMLSLRSSDSVHPPVIRTSVPDASGIDSLVSELGRTARAGGRLRRLRKEIVREAESAFALRLSKDLVDRACRSVLDEGREISVVALELAAR
ncbi:MULTISPECIES: methylmalonyl Co-A mutase-associated GTPase MeaB [unclassified Nocardioides]|uniref:methylmalonyl Co-A mutase-associated GTPase MeaB n=1 Tax=unclassified Nocardioides TaxID=2615069 RepID=UPI0009EA6B38|nr:MULTISPECIES: methylmalonyl Co-A mutase-associated GTPase MeaB [unclassified Nocardioides]